MQHLTVRKVPEKLADALQREKERRGTSLNQTVIDLLSQCLGVGGRPRSNGLGALGGTWSDADLAEFEAATKTFEQVDEELWD